MVCGSTPPEQKRSFTDMYSKADCRYYSVVGINIGTERKAINSV